MNNDRGFAHRGMTQESLLDLSGFDPVAANFDLAIHSSEVFEIAVGSPSCKVAGAIESSPGSAANGSGMKRSAVKPGLLKYPRAHQRRRCTARP